jgi:TolA-binding protein
MKTPRGLESMSNRVDELETKVSELQAAVNGLTEELVETKERVRQLENTVEVDDPAVRAKATPEPDAEPAQAGNPEPAEETAEASEADAADSDADADDEPEQRFVDAEAHEKELRESVGPEGSDEEAKSAEEKEDAKESESESEGSDIIVA